MIFQLTERHRLAGQSGGDVRTSSRNSGRVMFALYRAQANVVDLGYVMQNAEAELAAEREMRREAERRKRE